MASGRDHGPSGQFPIDIPPPYDFLEIECDMGRFRAMNRARLLCYGILAALGVAAGSVKARADVITLQVDGTLSALFGSASCDITGCLLGGNIVIDNVLGTVISANVTATGLSPSEGPFTDPSPPHISAGITDLEITTAPTFTAAIALLFSTPTAGSLVGYTGGPLDTITTIRPKSNEFGWSLVSGSLTKVAVTEVPEPSSLPLVLSAFAGIGLVGMVRKRALPQPTA